jgi:hypothetical protein
VQFVVPFYGSSSNSLPAYFGASQMMELPLVLQWDAYGLVPSTAVLKVNIFSFGLKNSIWI